MQGCHVRDPGSDITGRMRIEIHEHNSISVSVSPVTRLVPVGLAPPPRRKLLPPPEIRPTETCLALMVSVLPSHTAPMLLYTEANAPRAPNGPEWSLHEIRAGDGAGLTHGATNGIVRTSRRLPWYRVVLYNGM